MRSIYGFPATPTAPLLAAQQQSPRFPSQLIIAWWLAAIVTTSFLFFRGEKNAGTKFGHRDTRVFAVRAGLTLSECRSQVNVNCNNYDRFSKSALHPATLTQRRLLTAISCPLTGHRFVRTKLSFISREKPVSVTRVCL